MTKARALVPTWRRTKAPSPSGATSVTRAQASDERARVHLQRHCKPADRPQGDVPPARLTAGDVGAVKLGEVGECLLRETAFKAQRSQALGEVRKRVGGQTLHGLLVKGPVDSESTDYKSRLP